MKELKEDETDRSDDANPWGANDLVLAPEDRRDFEDAFTNTKAPFERLPDSAEYLAGLEAKLSRVQQKGSLVRDLQKRREDEVRRFMTGNAGIQVDFEGQETLGDNAVLRRLFPAGQALTADELTHLVKADQLDKQKEEQEQEKQDKKKRTESSSPQTDLKNT